MMKIGVLISGGGTNLQAIIDAIDNGIIDGKIELIISNKKDAYGLKRGLNAGIESIFIDPNGLDDVEYSQRLLEEFNRRDVDFLVLAGFLKILSQDFVREYENRIINIHPSLIPSFSGMKFYGDRVHKAVLDYGVKYSGATVHFVNENADEGPIILQEVVAVDFDDDIDSLKEKVLKVEHKLLVKAIRLFCENNLSIVNSKVKIEEGQREKSLN